MLRGQFFKLLVDNSSEAILISASDGSISYANTKALNLFLYDREELIGKPIEILIGNEFRSGHVLEREKYMESPKDRPHGLGIDVYALKKNGVKFPVEVSLNSIEQDHEKYVVSIVSDITKRKEKEKKIRDFMLEQQEVKNLQIKNQLEILKKQIGPHFLFNSLNLLYSLMEVDTKKAQLFAKRLTQIYAFVLESRNRRTIPLQKEISFLKKYIYILKIRFGDTFEYHIEKELFQRNDLEVIPLATQLLVENVLKHNKMSSKEKVSIEIFRNEEDLEIKNNITSVKKSETSYGIGLHNLQEQYKLLTSKKVKIANDGKSFKVIVPLIKNNK